MYKENRFGHVKKLNKTWYEGTTGIHPIDLIIKKVIKYSYCHHIERLMYLSNFMLISKIHPQEVYKWFMIYFIDAYEWVMIANINMGQYSSTSITMMSKIYLSSSNYIKLMSNYKLNSYDMITLDKQYYWNQIWDALYYNFINDNQDELKKIYSLSRNLSHWYKKPKKQKSELLNISKLYLEHY